MDGAGDVNAGRAWRTVRRPSDMVRLVMHLLRISTYCFELERVFETDQRVSSSGTTWESSRQGLCQRYAHYISGSCAQIVLTLLSIVVSVKWIELPLPSQPTALTCTLNNGIHFVTTPEVQLGKDCPIDQEFEL